MRDNTLRPIVRGMYQLQKLRIQTGNRIVGNWKVKMGQEPGKKETEMDAEGKQILKALRESFARLTDGIAGFPKLRGFHGDGVIDTYTELCLVAQYVEIDSREQEQSKRIASIIKEYPIWKQFLEGVKGCGPLMTGVLLSEIDIAKARYPSSLWAYAGLDVAHDGRGRSKKVEHLVEREYVNKDGEVATRVGITFNPFLKTKLLGVLAPGFLKAGENKYSDIYREYKHRLENHDDHGEKTKGHRHNMAMRRMVKIFLVDLYTEWRKLEGLPVSAPYHEAKLGHVHAA